MRRDEADAARDGAADRVVRRALLALGIDNLSVLEELFGEALGDEVMEAVRQRLKRCLPAGAELQVTRHRRFALELPETSGPAVARLFEQLQAAAAAEAIDTAHGPIGVTLSGGCAFADGRRQETSLELLRPAALQALQSAMARSVGSFQIARDEGALLTSRARLIDVSRAAIGAIGGPRLALAFQPVVRASGGPTVGFHECLVRLKRPDGGLVTAAVFMPAVERLGLAPLIDRQVLALSFETLLRHPTARLSVNVFPQTMQDAQWMALFERAVARHPGLGERLIVEMTETCSVLDPRRTLAFMDRLRRYGVAFALDDFGAGHTSLHYLRDFQFDIVKLDGRFIRNIEPGSDNAFFVSTILDIARRFDMMTVAEAVHGPDEARCLADLGVEFFQGFYFGCPNLDFDSAPNPVPGVAAGAGAAPKLRLVSPSPG